MPTHSSQTALVEMSTVLQRRMHALHSQTSGTSGHANALIRLRSGITSARALLNAGPAGISSEVWGTFERRLNEAAQMLIAQQGYRYVPDMDFGAEGPEPAAPATTPSEPITTPGEPTDPEDWTPEEITPFLKAIGRWFNPADKPVHRRPCFYLPVGVGTVVVLAHLVERGR